MLPPLPSSPTTHKAVKNLPSAPHQLQQRLYREGEASSRTEVWKEETISAQLRAMLTAQAGVSTAPLHLRGYSLGLDVLRSQKVHARHH